MNKHTFRVLGKSIPVVLLTFLIGIDSSLGFAEGFSPDPGGLKSMRILPLEQRCRIPSSLSVTAWPTGVIDADRTHYLNRDTTTILMLAVANPDLLNVQPVWLICQLPEGIELQTTNAHLVWADREEKKVTRDGKTYTRYRIPYSPGARTWVKNADQHTKGCGKGYKGYLAYTPGVLWLTTNLPAGAEPGNIYLQLEFKRNNTGDIQRGEETWIKTGVLPKIQADTPGIAKSGLMGRASISFPPTDTVGKEIIPAYIRQLGYNLYFDGPMLPKEFKGLKRWSEGRNLWQIRGAGYRHNLTTRVGVGNGFIVHLPREAYETMPKEIAFLDNQMKPIAYAVAPWAMYRRHPWVEENVLQPLRQEILDGEYEGVWANWEPQCGFEVEGRRGQYNGDCSEGSKREFIQWSKIPADEVENLWPHELVKKYPDQWRAFRNWELGMWAKVVAETIREASGQVGGDGYLIPCMPNDFIWDQSNTELVNCTTWPRFEYICQTWNYWRVPCATGPYPTTDRLGAPQVVRCGALVRFLDKTFGADRGVKSSCVYGWDQIGWTYFYTPEHTGFLHLSTILAGMDMVQNYSEWPLFDGRYAGEMAKANTRIARWEEFCLQGKKQRKHVVIPVSPYPQEVSPDVKPEDQEVKAWEMPGYLFSYEYERNGRRAFLVANTWDEGECFFKLRILDLDTNRKYILSEPEEKRVFADAAGRVEVSAEDLEEGVILHVGAMRWGAFLLEPAGNVKDRISSSRIITPAMMNQALVERVETLQKTMFENNRCWGPERKRDEIARQNDRLSRLFSRLAVAGTTDAAPAIDGVTDDACWKDAESQGAFVDTKTYNPARYPTTWKAVRRDGILYLAVDCKQDMTAPVANVTERDGSVWRDDSVEIFIHPITPKEASHDLQIVVNPASVKYDAYRKNKDWNKINNFAVAGNRDGWCAEIAVPMADVFPGETAFRMNVIRNVRQSAQNPPEVGSWYPVGESYEDVRNRGVLILK